MYEDFIYDLNDLEGMQDTNEKVLQNIKVFIDKYKGNYEAIIDSLPKEINNDKGRTSNTSNLIKDFLKVQVNNNTSINDINKYITSILDLDPLPFVCSIYSTSAGGYSSDSSDSSDSSISSSVNRSSSNSPLTSAGNIHHLNFTPMPMQLFSFDNSESSAIAINNQSPANSLAGNFSPPGFPSGFTQ